MYKATLPVQYNHQKNLPKITEKAQTWYKMHTMLENIN